MITLPKCLIQPLGSCDFWTERNIESKYFWKQGKKYKH